MEREKHIIQELFLVVFEKDSNFDRSKCDGNFWHHITNCFINFEQDRKPFYQAVYGLGLTDVESILEKLENLYQPFLNQLAEEHVMGYSSQIVEDLTQNNLFFQERLSFYKTLEQVIKKTERKQLKEELSTLFDKYTFEIKEDDLVNAITKSERKALKEKMKTWDKEVKTEKTTTFNSSMDNQPKVIALNWLKYTVAACFIAIISIFVYNNLNPTITPTIDVVNDDDSQQKKDIHLSFELPESVLADVMTKTQLSEIIINEGLGFTNIKKEIKIIEHDYTYRKKSIINAIESYQKYMDSLLKVNKTTKENTIINEIKTKIEIFNNELSLINTKEKTYWLNNNELNIYQTANQLVVLYHEDVYYLKKNDYFYVLIPSQAPLPLKSIRDAKKVDELERILFNH